MRNKIYTNSYFITATLLTLIIASCVFIGGCKPNSATTIQTNVSNNDVETTIIEDTTVETTSTEEATEIRTEQATEEETTELNYDEIVDFDAEYPYMIRINRSQNWTTIYAMDKKGRYSIPYKIFLCSTGKNLGDTPVGRFTLGQKYDWRLMVDGSYAQYAIRISGPIMLHSVPYYSQNKDDLEVEEYAKLGSPASLGCIRYNVETIKWIYDNCDAGTIVVIYDSEDEEPALELPTLTQPTSKGKKAGWDPTDPDKKNPWKKKSKKKNKNVEGEISEVQSTSEITVTELQTTVE